MVQMFLIGLWFMITTMDRRLAIWSNILYGKLIFQFIASVQINEKELEEIYC